MDQTEEIAVAPVRAAFRKKAEHVIARMQRRGFEGVFFPRVGEAVGDIVSRIPPGAVVALGGSMSVMQSGLYSMLQSAPVTLLDRNRPGLTPAEMQAMRVRGMTADVLIASSNAVTEDGRIVNMDGGGTRVSGFIFGPSRVILLVGANKIVRSVDEAISRIRDVAAPANCIRLGADTPCARSGFCDEEHCLPPARICSYLTVLEASRTPGRIRVVFVGEALGF